jgi:hypothetical protein
LYCVPETPLTGESSSTPLVYLPFPILRILFVFVVYFYNPTPIVWYSMARYNDLIVICNPWAKGETLEPRDCAVTPEEYQRLVNEP